MKYGFYILISAILLAACDKQPSEIMISSDKGIAESVYLTHDQDNKLLSFGLKKKATNFRFLNFYFRASSDFIRSAKQSQLFYRVNNGRSFSF